MELIASFQVNHLDLFPGLYVSRRDKKGEAVTTTFDMRMTAPNREPVMDMPAIHTIEHLGATYLRGCAVKDDIVYFGPMGCRTGFYVIFYWISREISPVQSPRNAVTIRSRTSTWQSSTSNAT